MNGSEQGIVFGSVEVEEPSQPFGGVEILPANDEPVVIEFVTGDDITINLAPIE